MSRFLSFFLGLLVGIMICVTIHYIEVKKLKPIIPPAEKKEIVTQVEKDTVFVEPHKEYKKQNFENKIKSNIVEDNLSLEQTEDEVSNYDSEFSFDSVEQDEVFADQLLQTKIVKVKMFSPEKQEMQIPDNFFKFFEIQLWSTPIKNKITYSRKQNMLKIKGVEMNSVNIFFWNDTYILEIGNRYYSIPETDNFDKLNLINLNK